ncbi:MAG: substrate-binding domain-containing protein [Candidatus Omnitrophota bacterium]
MRRNTIGLVIHHYKDMFGTFSAMEKIRGAKDAAFKKGVDLLIHISKKGSEFNYKAVDGVLFADLFENENLISKAKRLKIPYIILEYFDSKSPHNCIGIDNKGAVVKLIDKLANMGHKDIAIVTGKLEAKIGKDRLDGYLEGLRKNKLKINKRYIIAGDWTKESGVRAFKKLKKYDKIPTAIFVSGDEMALGVIEEVKRQGLRIPEDLSIIGFDDIPIASSDNISLSTVRQPLYDIGRRGVENLVKIIKEKNKKSIKLLLRDSKVILRKSVMAI